MEKQELCSRNSTIAGYLRSQFARQAIVTGIVLTVTGMIVFAASIKFSTDRNVKAICSEVGRSARIFVETSKLENYWHYHKEITKKLSDTHKISNLHLATRSPSNELASYSLEECTIRWRSDLQVEFYVPSQWAGDTVFVSGEVTPKFMRTDLLIFFVAVIMVLLLSYFFGTSIVLRNIQRKISSPIHEIWQGLTFGRIPSNLEIKEIKDLWQSLLEYKKLVLLRNQMFLAKEYYHEIKSPAFFQYNQLKRLSITEDPAKQKKIISNTLKRADELIGQMELALKKIARDDYVHAPTPIDLATMARKVFGGSSEGNIVSIVGDQTLIKTVLGNLYNNAVETCGDRKLISASVFEDSANVVLRVKNPVPSGTKVDIGEIFTSGYTTKLDGTGLGLSLCKHIVALHGGTIAADYSPQTQEFEITVSFPKKGLPDGNASEHYSLPS